MNYTCACSGGIYYIKLKCLVEIHESIFWPIIDAYNFFYSIKVLYIGGLFHIHPCTSFRSPAMSPPSGLLTRGYFLETFPKRQKTQNKQTLWGCRFKDRSTLYTCITFVYVLTQGSLGIFNKGLGFVVYA